MENEIMNNEMETEVIDLDMENDVIETEETDVGKAAAVAVAIGIGVAVAIVAIVRKNKSKFTEWQIRRLEKKGYVVTKCEETEATDCECEEIVEEDED